jgi:hypothetical protein
MMWPAHVKEPKTFFEAEGDVVVSDGTKVGCRSLTVTGTFVLPEVSVTQRTAFGILCTLKIYRETTFVQWAERWLSGADRSDVAAHAAVVSTGATPTNAVCDAAAEAAYHAAAAAYCAHAEAAAAYAAAAATAAANAANAALSIDFNAIAVEAMKY